MNLFCRAAVGPCGESQKHRIAQEVEIRLEARRTQSCSEIDRKCTLHQSTDQMTKSSRKGIFLTARLDLIQLHLLEKNKLSVHSKNIYMNNLCYETVRAYLNASCLSLPRGFYSLQNLRSKELIFLTHKNRHLQSAKSVHLHPFL